MSILTRPYPSKVEWLVIFSTMSYYRFNINHNPSWKGTGQNIHNFTTVPETMNFRNQGPFLLCQFTGEHQ